MTGAVTRVVSLVPSVTETLLEWGIEPIACTRFCEQPALRHVGGTKDPDVAAIISLEPDLVVVCDEENRREDADELVAAGIAVHACSPRSVAEVAPALELLAAALGVEPAIVDPVALPNDQTRARAFVPIWRRPYMSLAADTYGASLLAAIGVDVVLPPGSGGEDRYPDVALEAMCAVAPDLVIAPSEPYPFAARHVEELSTVAPVVLVDGRDLFWWGWRTPSALARLHAAIGARSLG